MLDLVVGILYVSVSYSSSSLSSFLSKSVIELIKNQPERNRLAKAGQKHAERFDWDIVAEEIFEVYKMAIFGQGKVGLTSDSRTWNRFWNWFLYSAAPT